MPMNFFNRTGIYLPSGGEHVGNASQLFFIQLPCKLNYAKWKAPV